MQTRIRNHILKMTHEAKASHVASSLSCVEILSVLYEGVLGDGRFIMSKGHAAAALYATLAVYGYFPEEDLKNFGSSMLTHVSHRVPGVEFSTGSLGHGLSVGCGLALAGERTYVLLSDGELNEGSTWEAIFFAGHHRLDQLTAIVDLNGMQSLGRSASILDMEPLGDKFQASHWEVSRVDGHDPTALERAFEKESPLPKVILAETIKGKGVPFMENDLLWHYRNPNAQDLEKALFSLANF